jgi:hypothetical protein
MSGETTTTSVTETVYGEWISPFLASYADQYRNPMQFFARFDPLNGSATVAVARLDSNLGNPNDDGASVDSEFNATDGTDLSATEMTTADKTFSISEYGVMRVITDSVLESSQSAQSILAMIAPDGAAILAAAGNDDGCALFAGLANSSGATGQNMSVAYVDDAIYDLAERGATGELVGVFDHQAVRDFQDNLQSQSSNIAVYAGAADRLMGVASSGDAGRNVEGYTLTYKGVPIYRTGLTDLANTNEDVVSAIFVRGDIESQRGTAAFGQGSLREFRLETERNASLRATEFVMTMRWGCGEIGDTFGQKLITDAP